MGQYWILLFPYLLQPRYHQACRNSCYIQACCIGILLKILPTGNRFFLQVIATIMSSMKLALQIPCW